MNDNEDPLKSQSRESAPTETGPTPRRRIPLPGWVVRSGPTLAVLIALASLAAWGHATGWNFSLRTPHDHTDPEDWCEEHGVPESQCVECQPNLLPRSKDYGWCGKHGVLECPFEHPDVAQLKDIPQIRPVDLERAERALDVAPRPENSRKCKHCLRRIQFASAEAVEKAGVDVRRAEEGPIVESVTANGEVAYDQVRVARLSSRLAGTTWLVPKQLGDAVKRGEVLALVDAAEVGRAKADFLQAIVQVELKSTALAALNQARRRAGTPDSGNGCSPAARRRFV